MKTAVPLLVIFLAAPFGAQTQRAPRFDVREATIATIHAAMKAGRLTCRTLASEYLRRIDAYDKSGPALNAIVQVNPSAMPEADELDRRYQSGAPIGALHCVPMIVKDNFETVGLQSAAGSLAIKGFVSTRDAFLVKRVKDAGAIVLAKSNMAEWAFSPYETVSSILPGYTRNPYALNRVIAGSSGGHRRELRSGRPRKRYRQLDPRPVVAPGARRSSIDGCWDDDSALKAQGLSPEP